MEDGRRGSLAREAEKVVGQLQGVSAVRVDLGDDGTISQMHVLASADRTPRVIAGDVVAALASQLGVSVEPQRVRVASQRPTPSEAPAGARSRLKFVGLSVSRLRTTADVRVQLEHKGTIYEGAASGPGAASHFLELVGQATLKAVETYLRAESLFLLQSASIVQVASHQIAVVVVSWLGPGEELLSGSAVVHEEPREAVVCAALNAVNRTVGWLGSR